jgi:hypothetical protein
MLCGSQVFVGSSEVGFVTACNFSPSRGHFHGFGILGAARLLKQLSEVDAPASFGRITPQLNGRLHLRLAGTIISSLGGVECPEVALMLVL